MLREVRRNWGLGSLRWEGRWSLETGAAGAGGGAPLRQGGGRGPGGVRGPAWGIGWPSRGVSERRIDELDLEARERGGSRENVAVVAPVRAAVQLRGCL